MIYKYIFILASILCLSSLEAHAQHNAPLENLPIKGNNHDQSVFLRWSPDSYESWRIGKEEGYEIVRITLRNATGQALTRNERLLSRDTLIASLRPLTQLSEWQALGQGAEKGFVGYQIYQTDSLAYKPSPLRNLRDAVKLRENQESQHLFATLLADGSFEIAKASALAYIDTTVEAGAKYRYIVTTQEGDKVIKGSAEVEASASAMSRVSALKAWGGDSLAVLQWSTQLSATDYTYYAVERSTDGQVFSRVNAEGHLGMSDASFEDDRVLFQDTLPNNQDTFYYRVLGISPFGFEGPPSDTVMVAGVPARLKMEVKIDSIVFDTDSTMIIDWSGLSHDWDAKLSGFNVYFKVDLDGASQLLNSTLLAPQERVFLGQIPEKSGYYILEAIDNHQYTYSSFANLGQTPDEEAPLAPQGLQGSMTNNGRIDLEWLDNTEGDLEGYKVLYSNGLNAAFIQVTKDHVDSSYYSFQVDPDVAIDSIFCQVIAIDKRYNMSIPSEVIGLKRPDNIPPSKPFLAQVRGSQEGIRIAWKLSSSDDVESYLLQRRTKEATTWNDVVSFFPNEVPQAPAIDSTERIPANYLDEANLEQRTYVYRLVARDQSGNQSASNERSIRPFDTGQKGMIGREDGVQVSVIREKEAITFAVNNATKGSLN